MLSKVSLWFCSSDSLHKENKLRKSSSVSPSALDIQKLLYFRLWLPSRRICRQCKESHIIRMIKTYLKVFVINVRRLWIQTLAGLRSERMIPSSWTYFSPLTKSHPNFLTTSSCRHPSWRMMNSSEPPDWLTDSRKRENRTESKDQRQ